MSRFLLGHKVQTHNNTLANLVRGVGERVLFTNRALVRPIKPTDPEVFEKRLASYRDSIVRGIGWQSPVTYDQFVGFYKGPRRLVYQRAVDSLRLRGVSPKDAFLKTFVKAEKLNFDVKNDPAPRVIQPRDPRFNVEVGCFLRPLEHKLYDELDKLFNAPTIMSPYNAYKQAEIIKTKWDEYSRPVCIGLDASRFDQHVSVDALTFEHSIYNRIFRSKKLQYLLNMQIKNTGFARASDGHFKYAVEGSRMSGDMNTSLGNKILMCLMAKAYLDSLSFRCSFVNNGDDCLLITEKSNLLKLDGLEAYFKDFGFNIVREDPVYEFEQVEFCQTKPILSNGTWRMVRNVKTCLTKDVTCVNLGHNVEEYRRLLYDIGQCGLTTAGDVPVLGAFYRMLLRFGVQGNYGGKFDTDYSYYHQSSRNAYCKFSSPDACGRYSFWLSTGICPDAQVELESYFNTSAWGADKRQLIDFDIHTLIW